ncbi:hypothetical protein LT679_14115 [Mucilaginibacter roseus]|uniref:Lipocalin-like domain-containing protein n=1 Tax=Mucilaginibacter roseus TaxID=1528868 RepID=A0ABS8U3P3_9SPHI|nr:hypothetical protein [Mucilaginibacter roseus]MCD8741746.1 hypothetical protein [Mucilaginibacter roseus]
MAKNIILLINITLLFLISGCSGNLKPEKLRGKWKYVKVFNPEAFPPDSISTMELQELKPYIEFTGDNKLQIIWGGKVLSKGTYRIEADNIYFKEDLGNGQTREFPFYVSSLSDKQIVFETVGADASKVTAVKE